MDELNSINAWTHPYPIVQIPVIPPPNTERPAPPPAAIDIRYTEFRRQYFHVEGIGDGAAWTSKTGVIHGPICFPDGRAIRAPGWLKGRPW